MGAAAFVTGTSASCSAGTRDIREACAELPPEFARKVALIRKAAFQGDFGQRFIRVHQSATRNAQPKFSQESLRGEMEGGAELPFERAERHVRNGREVPIGDLVMEMGAHVSQRRPEAGGGGFEAARGSGGASNPGRANDGAFRIDDGNLVGDVPGRRARDSPTRSSRLTMRWPARTCSSSSRN